MIYDYSMFGARSFRWDQKQIIPRLVLPRCAKGAKTNIREGDGEKVAIIG